MEAAKWRRAWRDKILPAVVAFRPDLIFISAGFDAHKKDELNLRFVGLLERDYEWVTEQIVQVRGSATLSAGQCSSPPPALLGIRSSLSNAFVCEHAHSHCAFAFPTVLDLLCVHCCLSMVALSCGCQPCLCITYWQLR